MKFSFNLLVQVLSIAVQVGNELTSVLPPKYHAAFALGVGALQGVVGLLAHFSNPNGTPVTPAS